MGDLVPITLHHPRGFACQPACVFEETLDSPDSTDGAPSPQQPLPQPGQQTPRPLRMQGLLSCLVAVEAIIQTDRAVLHHGQRVDEWSRGCPPRRVQEPVTLKKDRCGEWQDTS